MSHETIYLSLFVQGKGALRRELTDCLRTGRAYRRPKTKRAPSGKGQIVDPVMISERPAEVEDRAVPGHWEGDLLMGKRQTAIGTLVERHTRYVMLFSLPEGNTAEAEAAHSLNGRPRQTLDWMSPSEKLAEVLQRPLELAGNMERFHVTRIARLRRSIMPDMGG